MTPADAATVLALASGVDNRKHGETQARVWARIIGPDVALADAIEAVEEHYATSDKWLMPVHVIDGAKAIVRRRLGQARLAELEAEVLAENPGVDPAVELGPQAIEGGPHPSVASAIVVAAKAPAFQQRRPADLLREAAAAAAREKATQAEADDPGLAAKVAAARAEARAEVERLHAEQSKQASGE